MRPLGDPPPPISCFRVSRQAKAEALGLTYAEYTLEILERGIHLQVEDAEKIAAIKARRKSRGTRPS